MGRVFRLQMTDIEKFIEDCKVEPGTLSHLYPEPNAADAGEGDESGDTDSSVGD